MTEEQALAFMAASVVICEDADGTLFGVCEDDGSGQCVIQTPDRCSAHTLADEVDTEITTVEDIVRVAGARAPYAGGTMVLLQAPTTQAVNAVSPDEPQWVEDTTSVCLGTAGLYAMFSSMDPDALVAAALGKSNPWTQVE